MSKKYDLIGKTFGKLTVVDRSLTTKGKPWVCVCDCGNKKLVMSNRLLTGSVRSCGCLRSEVRIKDLAGQRFGKLVAIKRAGKKNNNSQVWECLCDCGNTCEVSARNLRVGSTNSCGCLLNEARSAAMKKAREVRETHYIYGTDLYQLCQEPRRNNTSGTVGVTYDSSTKLWTAMIEFKKKRYYLGSSKDINVAIKLRKEAENHLHGKFLEWYHSKRKND